MGWSFAVCRFVDGGAAFIGGIILGRSGDKNNERKITSVGSEKDLRFGHVHLLQKYMMDNRCYEEFFGRILY